MIISGRGIFKQIIVLYLYNHSKKTIITFLSRTIKNEKIQKIDIKLDKSISHLPYGERLKKWSLSRHHDKTEEDEPKQSTWSG